MRKILSCARRYIGYLIMAPLCIMGEVVLEVNIPRVMSKLVDIGIPSRQLETVLHYGLLMILMSVLSLLTGCLSTYFSSKGSIGFGSELRKAIFHKIQDFSFENIDYYQQSSLITRLTTDVSYIQMGMMMATRVFIRAPFMLVMALIVAMDINARLVKIFFITLPALAVLVVLVGYFAIPLFRKMMTEYDSLNQTVQEDLTSIRVIKSFVRSEHEKKRFSITNKNLMTSSIKVELLMSFMSPVMSLVIYSVTAAILWFGGQMIISETMTTGEMIS
ncbi:MAG: ABC transporter ATP-binding protein, partial [Erysipelotrichaceae bacterium]|nr:ABC transporter ATP-binding protein [Erysipelotrichaceae bacterium]